MGYFALSMSDNWVDQVKAAQENLKLLEKEKFDEKFIYLLDFALSSLEKARDLQKKKGDKEKSK